MWLLTVLRETASSAANWEGERATQRSCHTRPPPRGHPLRALGLGGPTLSGPPVPRALARGGQVLVRVALGEWVRGVNGAGDDEDRATLAFFEMHGAGDGGPAASRGVVDIPCTGVLARLGAAEAVGPELLAAYCRHAYEAGLLAPPPTRQ